MWSLRSKARICDISDRQASAVIEDGIISLGVPEQENMMIGFGEVSVVGQKVIQALSWEMLEAATCDDPELSAIREAVETGNHHEIAMLGGRFPAYKGLADQLSTVEGVVVYKGRGRLCWKHCIQLIRG